MPPSQQLEYMYRFMRRVLARIGPRESCGSGERQLADWLVKEWQPFCDSVRQEAFHCHPRAFLGSIRVAVGCYFAGGLLYWWGAPWLALLLGSFGILAFVLEFAGYHEFVDPLFPRRHSQNVVATIAPRSELRQRIVISAHMDSAFEFTLWRLLGDRSAWVLLLAIVGAGLLPAACATEALGLLLGWQTGSASHGFGIALLVLTPFVAACLFFHNGQAVPGAMDDLAGVSVLGALSRQLGNVGLVPGYSPEHTEVVLLATGCEEAGLRGAKRFVRSHAAELRRIPTYGVFVDGICDERRIAAVRREYCTGARYDKRLVALAHEIGERRGWGVETVDIPLGGTDAAAFYQAGLPAFTLVGMPCDTLIENYHTRLDTLDRIRPEALTRTLQIVADLVKHLDQECCAGPGNAQVTTPESFESGPVRVAA